MSRLSLSFALAALLFAAPAALANGLMDIEVEGDTENFCVDHGDCPAFFECVQLECTALTPGVCRKDSDCSYENAMYCEVATSLCRYFCYNDYDCEDNEYCDIDGTWHCLPQGEGDSDNFCTSDDDCDEATQYCETITHTCRPKCFSGDDCPEGWACIDYRCQPESPGDLDWDIPWGDYEEWGESVEVPDWEMPEVFVEYDDEPEIEIEIEAYEYAESGGLGESGLIIGEDDTTKSAGQSSSSCAQADKSGSLLFIALLLSVAGLRRRRALWREI